MSPTGVCPRIADDQVAAAGEGSVAAVTECDHGMSVGQAGALAVRWRHVHGVDAEDVRHPRQLDGRPPPIERHGATVVEGFEDTGEFRLARTGRGVEVLDRVLDETLGRLVGCGQPMAGVLDAPRPRREPFEVGEIDDRTAEVDDRRNVRARWQRPGRERVRVHRRHHEHRDFDQV